MSLLLIVLSILCAWLALSLLAKRRVIASVLDAAEEGRPVLLEQRNGLMTGRQLDRLVQTFNRLSLEKADISSTGKGYFDQIQTTLGNLREAVVMVDRDGTIRLANPVFAELVRSAGDPLGKRLDLFIRGEAFHEFLREIRVSGDGRREELSVEIGAQTRWFDVSAAPLPENVQAGGNYTLFVFHDITRQKKLEMMRTEFVANVSHELKTPVTIIMGFAETLVDDEEILSREERKRFLEKIRANADRLHTLLQDLLLLSRLESTEMVLQREPVRLRSFIRELASNWEPGMAEAGCRLVLDLSEEADVVDADPLRLNQILTNLLDNVQGHAKGSTEARIETALEGEQIRISVRDDGAGIPEADLPHIFQRFYRADKGRSRESGGTGLGLSIVKHIVAQHGGEVKARSRKGEGAAIDIYLPRS